MEQIKNLTLFLILSLLLPGIIIYSAILLLLPDVRTLLNTLSTFQSVSVVLVISFLNGHPAFLVEKIFLDKIWDKIHKTYNIQFRKGIINRSKVIAAAEMYNLSHSHFDQTLGEFILFTNTAIWTLLISVLALIFRSSESISIYLIVFIIIICLIALLFVCPTYKKSYLDILDVLNNKVIELEKGQTKIISGRLESINEFKKR